MLYDLSIIFGVVGLILLFTNELIFRKLFSTIDEHGNIVWINPIYKKIYYRILFPAMVLSMILFLLLSILDGILS